MQRTVAANGWACHGFVAPERETSPPGDIDLYLRLIGLGLQRETCACTLCESEYVRVSRRKTPWWLRLAGLALFRCESCRRLVLLPRRFVAGHDLFGRA